MRVIDSGVPVQDLIETVKQAIKAANVSRVVPAPDLRIVSVRLLLNTVATRSYGADLSFHVPVIGTEVSMGGKSTRQDTHEIEIGLVPPAPAEHAEIRDGDLDLVLVDAIATIRATLAAAASGEDPFVLEDSTIKIAFGITRHGDISIGINGALNNELAQTVVISLGPT